MRGDMDHKVKSLKYATITARRNSKFDRLLAVYSKHSKKTCGTGSGYFKYETESYPSEMAKMDILVKEVSRWLWGTRACLSPSL